MLVRLAPGSRFSDPKPWLRTIRGGVGRKGSKPGRAGAGEKIFQSCLQPPISGRITAGSPKRVLFRHPESSGWFPRSANARAGFINQWSSPCLVALYVIAQSLFPASPAAVVIATCECAQATSRSSPGFMASRPTRRRAFGVPPSILKLGRMEGRIPKTTSLRLAGIAINAGTDAKRHFLQDSSRNSFVDG